MQQRFRPKQSFAWMLSNRRPVGGNKLRKLMAETFSQASRRPPSRPKEQAVPGPSGFHAIDARGYHEVVLQAHLWLGDQGRWTGVAPAATRLGAAWQPGGWNAPNLWPSCQQLVSVGRLRRPARWCLHPRSTTSARQAAGQLGIGHRLRDWVLPRGYQRPDSDFG